MTLVRWNDDRLDDLYNRVLENTRRLEEYAQVRAELGQLRERLEHVGSDTHECVGKLEALKADLERRAQMQHDERKADRRWMIATLLTTAGLVIAALAIFVG